jgi:hypothetical protein
VNTVSLPALELDSGEFVASVIADSEDHVLVVGEQLYRVHLVQFGGVWSATTPSA